MNQTINELFKRKSIRQYEDRPVEDEKKKIILESAIQAPTAGNMSLYSIIDITNQDIKDRLAITCDNQPFIAKAPMVLIFCADYSKWYKTFTKIEDEVRKPGVGDMFLAIADSIIAAQNTVIAAESLGIGSCYIGDILENFEIHKELLKLPKYVIPVAMLVYGYPTKQQQERIKPKRLAIEDLVYENTYDSLKQNMFNELIGKMYDKENDDLTDFLKAFCKRKWNSEFSKEMTRSVEKMIKDWIE